MKLIQLNNNGVLIGKIISTDVIMLGIVMIQKLIWAHHDASHEVSPTICFQHAN